LPLEWNFFGLNAPNCLLLAEPGLLVANLVDSRGCGSLSIDMPFTPVLRGSSYYSQWFGLDAVNPAGLVASNALEFTSE
jgi:hypothetical protein